MTERADSAAVRAAAGTICDIGRSLWQRSYVAANDGNLSIRVGDQVVCTPTGVSKGFLTPDRLSVVGLDGTVVTGSPSSEIKMHLAVYQLDPTVGGIVHAHPLFATMWAIVGEPLICRMLPEAVVALPEVPLAPYATPSTTGVPDSVAPFVADYRACLLEHHGALTWDKDLLTAYLTMERLEYTAELLWRLREADRGRDLPDAEIARIKALFRV
jgi:L-fuculose-phosphate aldolase